MSKKTEFEEEKILISEFCERLQLTVIYDAEQDSIAFSTYHINRPGLQLTGFFEHFVYKRVQVVGEMELSYLNSLSPDKRQQAVDAVLSYDIPCMIISHNVAPCIEIINAAKKYKRILLKSNINTTFFVNQLSGYLNEILAQSITIHGVLIDVYGVGMLITGDSGVGKSEIALELVQRGHRLVADDAVVIKSINDILIGSSPPIIRYFMEVRGIGIVDIRSIYGAGSVRTTKKIEMCINLEEWKGDKNYDRLGTKGENMDILDKTIPKFTIPVKTGRNIAVILEVAARNFRLKAMGYDTLKELNDRMLRGGL